MRLVVSPEEAFALGAEPLVIGSAKACDVRILDAALEHARVSSDGVEALAPCSVGGVPLASGERRALVPGCIVAIGSARIVVDDEDVGSSVPTRELALRMVARGEGVGADARIVVVQGPDRGTGFNLVAGSPLTVGRAPDATLKISDEGVSRTHVSITFDDGVVLVKDLGATQGSYLGEKRLELRRNVVWTPEAMLRLGESTVLGLVLGASSREKTRSFIVQRRGTAAPPEPPPPPAIGTAAAIAEVVADEVAPPSIESNKKRRDAAERRDRVILYGGIGLVALAVISFIIWLFH